MTHRYFAIFGAMRTGSNLLERSLGDYKGLAAEGELFNAHFIGKPKRRDHFGVPISERNADPVGFLQTVIDAHEGAIPGFRIFDGHDARMLDHAARDPACAAIVLRRNPVDSFISLAIAGETGQWMLMKEENRRLAKIRFDPAAFEAYEAEQDAHYDSLRRKFLEAGRPAAWVRYEDLEDLGVINGLARWIGSPERKSAAPDKTQRQNPASWEDKVENVEELKAYAAGRRGLGPPPDPDPEPRPRFGALGELVASRAFEAIYAPIPGAGAAEFRRFLTDAAETAEAENTALATGLREGHVERRRGRGGFVFSFIRHPAERIHDVFLRRIARVDGGVFAQAQMHMARDYRAPTPGEMEMSAEARSAGFDAFLNFIEDNLAGRTQAQVDPAWTPQSTLLAQYAVETPVDFIGRCERLDADLAYIAARIAAPADGLAQKIESQFRRQSEHWPLSAWLTPEREARLRRIYERDYARLGYAAAAH